MAFHRRKLLNPSVIDPNLTKYCSPFCDAENNPAGICPFDCLSLCYHVCYTAFPHTLPSPPPFPPPPTTVVYPIAPHKPQKLSLFLTVSLAVLATAFFIFTCYILYKFYSCWYNSRRRRRLERIGPDQDPGSVEFLDADIDQGPVVDHHVWYIRTIGLQPSVISKISVVKYKKGDGLVEGTDCSVCLNEFQEDENLRLLPKCNHAFHIPCIDTWLRSHTNCPMCRAGIVTSSIQALEEDAVVHNSGQVEETRIEDPGIIDQASEIRIGIEEQEDNESRAQAQLGHKIDHDDDDGVQQMRRSVSLDSLSATAIYSTVADAFPGRNSDNRLVETKSPLNEESCKIGSSSVKRSHSCSAKVFLSRYNSRSRDSVIPR